MATYSSSFPISDGPAARQGGILPIPTNEQKLARKLSALLWGPYKLYCRLRLMWVGHLNDEDFIGNFGASLLALPASRRQHGYLPALAEELLASPQSPRFNRQAVVYADLIEKQAGALAPAQENATITIAYKLWRDSFQSHAQAQLLMPTICKLLQKLRASPATADTSHLVQLQRMLDPALYQRINGGQSHQAVRLMLEIFLKQAEQIDWKSYHQLRREVQNHLVTVIYGIVKIAENLSPTIWPDIQEYHATVTRLIHSTALALPHLAFNDDRALYQHIGKLAIQHYIQAHIHAALSSDEGAKLEITEDSESILKHLANLPEGTVKMIFQRDALHTRIEPMLEVILHQANPPREIVTIGCCMIQIPSYRPHPETTPGARTRTLETMLAEAPNQEVAATLLQALLRQRPSYAIQIRTHLLPIAAWENSIPAQNAAALITLLAESQAKSGAPIQVSPPSHSRDSK
ncbi:MAG: hypothetical protein AB7O99_04450 [Dongiaceae bacterium]